VSSHKFIHCYFAKPDTESGCPFHPVTDDEDCPYCYPPSNDGSLEANTGIGAEPADE